MTRAKDISKIVTDADLSGTLDVTGAVTAGGLTMDTGGNSTHTLEFGANRTSDGQALGIIKGSWNSTVVSQINLSAGDDTTNKDNGQIFFRTAEAGTTANRLRIEENGDISFYEDTGTTPKLFWDASAESLLADRASSGYMFETSGGIRAGIRSDDQNNLTLRAGTDAIKMHVGADGNVGIGLSSNIDRKLHVEVDNTYAAKFGGTGGGDFAIEIGQTGTNQSGGFNSTNETMKFSTEGSEKMRLDNGHLLVGTTSTAGTSVGSIFLTGTTGRAGITSNGDDCMRFNRLSSDGILVRLMQASSTEGNISVSGSLVSYNGGHLSRWSQLSDNTRDNTLVKGTVMTNLDQMAEWTTDGVTEDNEQLNCMAVSNVEGDANVAGVFINWDDDDDIYTNDMNIAMTGDVVIRIAQGTTVARGDLLMSAGDGTAKPQGDDIVRSKTIAKVTSTNVSHTYDDGTYLVPCVLMAC